jgi:hypothetical protein
VLPAAQHGREQRIVIETQERVHDRGIEMRPADGPHLTPAHACVNTSVVYEHIRRPVLEPLPPAAGH